MTLTPFKIYMWMGALDIACDIHERPVKDRQRWEFFCEWYWALQQTWFFGETHGSSEKV